MLTKLRLYEGPSGPEMRGTVDGQVLTWDALTEEWNAAAVPPSPGGSSAFLGFPVNSAGAEILPGGVLCLRTGSSVNPAGAFNGGGAGNKTFVGLVGFDGLPMGSLTALEFTWRNVLGPGGANFLPPTAATVTTPYCNLLVDFAPSPGPGDLRVLICMTDQLAPAISGAIGSYFNNGLNVLTYSWTSAKAVCIVGVPPAASPGGVAPAVTVGPGFLENAYSWAALVAANPTAKLVTSFPGNVLFPTGDGGAPVGAILPSILLVSGDSGNVTKSGKRLSGVKVNGVPIL